MIDEFEMGWHAARRHVRDHDLRYAIDFAYDADLDDPFWEGYMAYLEEVM